MRPKHVATTQAQTKLTSDQNLDILKALMEEPLHLVQCLCCNLEFWATHQETDIRIAEVKRDAYEFRPGGCRASCAMNNVTVHGIMQTECACTSYIYIHSGMYYLLLHWLVLSLVTGVQVSVPCCWIVLKQARFCSNFSFVCESIRMNLPWRCFQKVFITASHKLL